MKNVFSARREHDIGRATNRLCSTACFAGVLRLLGYRRGEISISELFEQGAADTAHRAFLARAVERHGQADALVHEQRPADCGKTECRRRSSMMRWPLRFASKNPTVMPLTGGAVWNTEVMHQTRGFRLQQRRSPALLSIQVRDHEARHISTVALMLPCGAPGRRTRNTTADPRRARSPSTRSA